MLNFIPLRHKQTVNFPSLYSNFFAPKRCALPPSCLYQKNERAMPGSFLSHTFLLFLPRNKCSFSHYIPKFFLCIVKRLVPQNGKHTIFQCRCNNDLIYNITYKKYNLIPGECYNDNKTVYNGFTNTGYSLLESNAVLFGRWKTVFRKNLLPQTSSLKMKRADSSEALVCMYQGTRRSIPINLHIHGGKMLTSQTSR
jgi:hypothetical protein